jgi:hypothetical protein
LKGECQFLKCHAYFPLKLLYLLILQSITVATLTMARP